MLLECFFIILSIVDYLCSFINAIFEIYLYSFVKCIVDEGNLNKWYAIPWNVAAFLLKTAKCFICNICNMYLLVLEFMLWYFLFFRMVYFYIRLNKLKFISVSWRKLIGFFFYRFKFIFCFWTNSRLLFIRSILF